MSTPPSTLSKFIVKDLTNGEAITIDYTTPAMIPANYPIRALTLGTATTGAPETGRTLYAGTLGKGVYKSTDSGYQLGGQELRAQRPGYPLARH